MSEPVPAREADSRTRELSQPSGDRTLAAATAVRIGGALGRYVIVRRIGEGGMGIVYEAHDPELGRTIALKLLWPARRTPERTARLKREAQAMARISHPDVVQVFDVGSVGEHVFLAMELVRGRNLSQWLAEKRRPWPEVLAVMLQAARGLAAAHAAGLVHRDVKPGNILVDDRGHAKVGDFGLAHAIVDAEPTGAPSRDSDTDAPLVAAEHTAAGAGTPNYMPPEQHVGAAVDARGDQYAFCVTLWEALHGARPFRGAELHALLVAKLEHDPKPPRGNRVPKWLTLACLRGLSPRPEQRFASMDELIARLDRRGGRALPWLVGGAAAIASASIASSLAPSSRCDDAMRELAGTWDDDVKRELQRRVGASDLPWAAPTWTSASGVIDEWSARWIGVRGSVCETAASTEPGELDRRIACLRGGRAALATVVELVRDGETPVLRDVVSTVTDLPPPERCLVASPSEQLDEPTRAKVAATREQL
ncbi:MAG TPA: serine/threonine-protein kinase, partial [Nannocystaceae bacterium]|nr:serine/threonine-protein kinase [Nannocystaceae bacterium]